MFTPANLSIKKQLDKYIKRFLKKKIKIHNNKRVHI